MGDAPSYVSLVTAPGEGGIGIIALWGAGAEEVLAEVFVGTKRQAHDVRPGSIAHGTVRRGGEVLDEVIVARLEPPEPRLPGPFYEVNCHGGAAAVRAVLRWLEEAGARQVPWREMSPAAQAGAGPLDPAAIRASALAALPQAATQLAATMLLHQAAGALAGAVGELARLLADEQTDAAAAALDALLQRAPLGRALLRPSRVALAGPPNVGKSTLLNALLEEERVIVHEQPGTTRDVVAETVSLRGVPFELFDSAGLRDSEDELEQAAVARTARLVAQADVVLLLFDAREGPASVASLLPVLRQDARLVLVGNKADLLAAPLPGGGAVSALLYVSARLKTNIAAVESALLAPYADSMEAVRQGCATPFEEESEAALRRVRAALAERGPQAALELLLRAGVRL